MAVKKWYELQGIFEGEFQARNSDKNWDTLPSELYLWYHRTGAEVLPDVFKHLPGYLEELYLKNVIDVDFYIRDDYTFKVVASIKNKEAFDKHFYLKGHSNQERQEQLDHLALLFGHALLERELSILENLKDASVMNHDRLAVSKFKMLDDVEDVVLDDFNAIKVPEDQRKPCEIGQIRVVNVEQKRATNINAYCLVVKKEASTVLTVPLFDRPYFKTTVVVEKHTPAGISGFTEDTDYLRLYPLNFYIRYNEDNFVQYSKLTDWKLSNEKDLEMFL